MHDPANLVNAASDLVGDRVGKLGTSVYETAELDAAVDDGRFRIAQVPMSVVDRRIDDATLERAAAADVQLVARSVFLQGLILALAAQVPARLQPLVPYLDAVHMLAREAGMSLATLALGWVRQRPGIAGVVVGAHSEHELEELAAAWAAPQLDDTVSEACRALVQPPARLCDPRQW